MHDHMYDDLDALSDLPTKEYRVARMFRRRGWRWVLCVWALNTAILAILAGILYSWVG